MLSLSYKKYLTVLLSLTALFLVMVQIGFANTVVRSGDSVSVAADQSVPGDFYAAASTINISGTLQDDAVLIGGQVTVNGAVNADVFIVGANVDVHGTVGDDLRVIGGEVTIAEPIAGDVALIGGSVNILSSASIGGDLLVYGAEVVVDGPVSGDVLGSVSSLRLNSTVGGDVDVRVTSLFLEDQADLSGDLDYVSFNPLNRSLNANISGSENRKDPISNNFETDNFGFLVPVLMMIFSVLSWYLVSKKTLNSVVNRALVKNPKPALIGFAFLVLAPIASLVLIVSMVGSVVGISILFAYLLLITLATIALPAVLGQLLMVAFTKAGDKLSLLSILIGVLVLVLVLQLPVIGMLLVAILFLIATGAILESVYRR